MLPDGWFAWLLRCLSSLDWGAIGHAIDWRAVWATVVGGVILMILQACVG